ncbi:unnamed protein product [Protopolystoma xenopodis]|uniref:Uncharacterized protein n=1 Tax=Protopolystoma xenopodis TaxID=117903 RepID=A0A3S5A9S0_9PLAT|nr:unnamed protein product [Protopolystoma xenopodis]
MHCKNQTSRREKILYLLFHRVIPSTSNATNLDLVIKLRAVKLTSDNPGLLFHQQAHINEALNAMKNMPIPFLNGSGVVMIRVSVFISRQDCLEFETRRECRGSLVK